MAGTMMGNSVEVDGVQHHVKGMIGGGWRVDGVGRPDDLELTIKPYPSISASAICIVVNRSGHVVEVRHI